MPNRKLPYYHFSFNVNHFFPQKLRIRQNCILNIVFSCSWRRRVGVRGREFPPPAEWLHKGNWLTHALLLKRTLLQTHTHNKLDYILLSRHEVSNESNSSKLITPPLPPPPTLNKHFVWPHVSLGSKPPGLKWPWDVTSQHVDIVYRSIYDQDLNPSSLLLSYLKRVITGFSRFTIEV